MIRRKGAKKKEKKEGKEDERIRDGERESKDDAWPRRWGPVGDEHIGGKGEGEVCASGRKRWMVQWKRKSLAGYFPAGIFIGGSAMLGRWVGVGGGGRGLAVAPGNASVPASNRTRRGGGPRAAGRPSGAGRGRWLQATTPYHRQPPF